MSGRLLSWAWLGIALVAGCGRTMPLFYDEDAGVDAGPPVGCTPGSVSLLKATPVVMFVLNRSGSMAQSLDGTRTGESKWQSLTLGLAGTLPEVDQTMQIGALVFPTGSSQDDCEVPGNPNLAPAEGNVQPLLSIMIASVPGGSTPTSDALQSAAAQLAGLRSATTARALVLATDGEPNCNASLDTSTCTCGSGGRMCRDALQCLDDTRTDETLRQLAAEGLPTYVIGLQSDVDSSFVNVLDGMAIAGGRPRTGSSTSFYAANSDDDLDTALTEIRDQVGSCLYLTTSVPDAQGNITVTLDGVVIPEDPTGTNGWTWGDRSNGEIVVLGNVCNTLSSESAPSLVAQVSCGSPDAGSDGGS